MNENDTCERRDTFLLCIYLLLGGNSLLDTTEAENTKQVLALKFALKTTLYHVLLFLSSY